MAGSASTALTWALIFSSSAAGVPVSSGASTASADAKVDTTAPTAPSLTLGESSAKSYVSGTTLYYNAQGSNTASFTVTGTDVPSDPQIARRVTGTFD